MMTRNFTATLVVSGLLLGGAAGSAALAGAGSEAVVPTPPQAVTQEQRVESALKQELEALEAQAEIQARSLEILRDQERVAKHRVDELQHRREAMMTAAATRPASMVELGQALAVRRARLAEIQTERMIAGATSQFLSERIDRLVTRVERAIVEDPLIAALRSAEEVMEGALTEDAAVDPYRRLESGLIDLTDRRMERERLVARQSGIEQVRQLEQALQETELTLVVLQAERAELAKQLDELIAGAEVAMRIDEIDQHELPQARSVARELESLVNRARRELSETIGLRDTVQARLEAISGS
ncbi:MAG: hypothetical protein AB8G96_04035 [Phycisphaerales bacterium]